MRRTTLIAVSIIALMVALPIYARTDTLQDLYPKTMTVVEVDRDNNLIVLEDTDGHLWEYENSDVWFKGDKAAVLMDMNGTTDVTNDTIIKLINQGQ